METGYEIHTTVDMSRLSQTVTAVQKIILP